MLKIITIFTKIIIAVLLSISFYSCKTNCDWGNGTKGNGNLTTETRKIDTDFSSIEVSAAIEVILEQSDNKSVTVEAESNLQSLIETKVSNGVLQISPSDSYNATKSVLVRVKMPIIDALQASSSAKISSINTIKSASLNLSASSAAEIDLNTESDEIRSKSSSGSNITLQGKALKITTTASSGSQIKAKQLLVNEVIADASSGSDIKVHPLVKLDAHASSGASIRYDSEPKTVDKSESSGGSVHKN
jgi:Putative auto-transporter adhesin, head GIN domain